MSEDEIVLDKKTFEALAMDTRISILKSLKQRRKTQTEISKEMKMAASTISEHLDKMIDANLVEKQKQGKKWVYYSLTGKGLRIVEPGNKSAFVFALSMSLVLVFTGLFLMNPYQISTATGDVDKNLEDAATIYNDSQLTAGINNYSPEKDDSIPEKSNFGELLLIIGMVLLAYSIILVVNERKIRRFLEE